MLISHTQELCWELQYFSDNLSNVVNSEMKGFLNPLGVSC